MLIKEKIDSLNRIFDANDFDDYELAFQIKDLLENNNNAQAIEKVNLLIKIMESQQQDECRDILEKMFENIIYIKSFPDKKNEHNWYALLTLAGYDIAHLMILSPKVINRNYIESIWDDCLSTANDNAMINGVKTALNFTWEEIFETDIGI
jgi:hypothetical protein